MARFNSAKDELHGWKNKYFDLKVKVDNEQYQADAFRSVLQRILLRLCFAAEGQSKAFDDELQRVRADVRNPKVAVQELAERLSQLDQAFTKVDALKSESAELFSSNIAEMAKLLDSVKPPSDDKRALKKIIKLTQGDGLMLDQYGRALADFAEVQRSVFEWMQAQSQAPAQPGLLSRLFGGDGKAEAEQASGEHAPVQSELSDALEIETREGLEDDEVVPGFSAISVHVRATLNHLIDQLTFPESSQRALNDFREKISGPLNWYELGPTLDELSNIVISAIGRGQRDFGSFLSDIDERLCRIQAVVLDTMRADESYQSEESSLGQVVREQISCIRESLDGDLEIEALKGSINAQVDNIADALESFTQASLELRERKEKDYELLQARVGEMEHEARLFTQRLQEERRRALTDALTSLPNREAFNERLLMEYERWQRYRKPATLVVVDVDHFKRINDTYGHMSGDKVLQILAKELQNRLRKSDFISRYGGEEFVFILPETELDTAVSVMNKTREMISRLPFHFRDSKVQITVSMGAVAFQEGLEMDALFELADKALYRAKQNGRNRIELAAAE